MGNIVHNTWVSMEVLSVIQWINEAFGVIYIVDRDGHKQLEKHGPIKQAMIIHKIWLCTYINQCINLR